MNTSYARFKRTNHLFPITLLLLSSLLFLGLMLMSTAQSAFASVDAAVSGGGGGGGGGGGSNGLTISIGDSGFVSPSVWISTGVSLQWENTSDNVTHTIVFSDGQSSAPLGKHATYSRTFLTPGDYPYYCAQHPSETAIIHVSGDAVPTATVELHLNVVHDQAIQGGATVTYHVQYINHSDYVDALGVVISVTLPPSGTLFSTSPVTQAQSGETLVYQIGSVGAKAQGQIDLVIVFAPNLPSHTSFPLMATLSASNLGSSSGSSAEDNSEISRPLLTVGARPFEGVKLAPGKTVTYLIEYANRSSKVAADNVTITLQLPDVISFITAIKDDSSHVPTVPLLLEDSLGGAPSHSVSFFVGTVNPDSNGRILARLSVSDTVTGGQKLQISAQITSTNMGVLGSEGNDNVVSETEDIPTAAADLYIRLHSSGDTEISGTRIIQVYFGNAGLSSARNIKVTVTLPGTLHATLQDFGITPPTTFISNVAVWQINVLPGQVVAPPLTIQATIIAQGSLSTTATIEGTSDNTGEKNSRSAFGEDSFVIPILPPRITSPNGSIVGMQPAFRGIGRASAEVSLYLSGTVAVPGQLLGSAIVGMDNIWVITPTSPLPATGWFWVTATQMLTTVNSGIAGVRVLISDTLRIDPASVTRNGISTGGLNPHLVWRAVNYRIGMKINPCGTPLTPTLQALLFNAQGLMTGYRNFTATNAISGTGYVEFDYRPVAGFAFELYVEYYCPAAIVTDNPVHYSECFIGMSCSDNPPEPPQPCDDCSYDNSPPHPITIDPDGFIYDAVPVRSGSTVTQSIITSAWVTITRQTGPATFAPWNAFDFNQVNPQYTDSIYPDKVQSPGYYSFLVPPGSYRIQVTALGFLPYDSVVLQVTSAPISLNVGLERTNGAVATNIVIQHSMSFLPLIQR